MHTKLSVITCVPCNVLVTASVLVLAFVLFLLPASAIEPHQSARHPSAAHHQPPFITPPGETDALLVVIAFVMVAAVLAFGVFFFWLHNLPERLVHNSTKAQFDIVAALALLSLLTHIHLFWVLALLIALVKIPMPDFTGLLGRIAGSLEKIADTTPGKEHRPRPIQIERPAPARNVSMLELLFCSLFTRRPGLFVQTLCPRKADRPRDHDFFGWIRIKVWHHCMPDVDGTLITMVFYFHPSTTNAVSLFRAVPIVPETNGRVAQIDVDVSAEVARGAPIFRLDSAQQEAALEVAKRNISEVEAQMITARAEIAAAEGQIQEAKGAYEAAVDELRTKTVNSPHRCSPRDRKT